MLKGSRCESAKCPMEKQERSLPPGMSRAFRRGRGTEYGKRLREKQKVKRYYGLFERQFRKYFERAQHTKGNTGEALLVLIERRLDNVVCKLGFAPSRKAARVAIVHGHFTMNGELIDKPGYLVRVGDRVGVRKQERSQTLIRSRIEADPNRPIQPWLQLNPQELRAEVVSMPSRDDVQFPVEEQLVIESCSR